MRLLLTPTLLLFGALLPVGIWLFRLGRALLTVNKHTAFKIQLMKHYRPVSESS
jgi:hypothetical protein